MAGGMRSLSEPGGWLMSPMAFMSDEGLATRPNRSPALRQIQNRARCRQDNRLIKWALHLHEVYLTGKPAVGPKSAT